VTQAVGLGYRYDLPGLVAYDEALALMDDLAAARSQGAVPDTLLLLEHEPVVTLGSATDAAAEVPPAAEAALAARGIPVTPAGRGGRATYHGPGQLVGYPIFDLADHGRDVRRYVQTLEGALVAALADLGVAAEIRQGEDLVGIWCGTRKIGSVGIHVARWISTHGFSVNVSCDPEPFGLFVVCGLPGLEVTTVEREAGRPVTVAEVADAVVARIGEAFVLEFETVPAGALA
jgi:lipoyl(octanoyl) transferase